MEISPGIHQFKIPIPDSPPDFFLNAYLLQGERGWLLVDAGWNAPESIDSLEKQLKQCGVSFSDIDRVVFTHVHPDHYGMAQRLKELCRAELAFHRAETAFILYIQEGLARIEELSKESLQWLRRNGIPEAEQPVFHTLSLAYLREFASAPLPDWELSGGETISTGYFNLEVLWTPGHSSGHVCLYEPEKKILFSGDHLLPLTTSNISLYEESEGNPLADYLDSLQAVGRREVKMILPGHEHPFQELSQRVAAMIWHHSKRASDILRALQGGARTTYEISATIPWIGPGGTTLRWQDLSPPEKMLALMETLAHLQFLINEGKVERTLEGEVCHYILSRRG